MDATLKCPKCAADIPLTDAFRKEIEAEVLAEEHARHAKELDEARTAAASAAVKKAEADSASRESALRAEAQEEKERNSKLLKQLEDLTAEMRALRRKDEERDLEYKQRLAADEDRIRAETRKSVAEEFLLKDVEKDKRLADASAAAKKAEQEYASREAGLRAEATEEKDRNARLLKQLEELTGEMRTLKRKDEERELAYKQQLAADEDRIRAETRKSVADEFLLKDLEKDKRLADALRQVEDLKAKIQQGSQQVQGEVLEVELEELLRQAFRDDQITEVKKGQRGADVLQKVNDRRGRFCGTILWETKNAHWTDTWIAKLRADQREAKAQIAVLVAEQPPSDVETFLYRDGVWIVQRRCAKDLALMLRYSLVQVYAERVNLAGKDEKMEVLYQYLTSVEFQHRIQAIVEGFSYLWADVEREKRWFASKWARQEKEIRKIIDSTQGMYGDLQAVTGRSLAAIPALDAPSDHEIVDTVILDNPLLPLRPVNGRKGEPGSDEQAVQ
jgi:hypothetical protein